MLIRFLISLHRWLGVALCALFLLWFPSGIGMMYWGMPSVTAGDRLARAPALAAPAVVLSPAEAAARIGVRPSPADVRLTMFDGRPAYRFSGGGRGGGGGRVVYADTGEEQGRAPLAQRNRVAAAWTGQPAEGAVIEPVTEPDQWTVGSQLRSLRPLWKYSWPNGEQVYIGESAEVLLYTTPATRLQAYLSAVPHWLYFTPLRKHQPVWIRLATYAAMIGTVGAIVGVVLAAWMYSPAKRYRHAGAPSRIPYRGQKRWHTILGLVFGVATVTWTLSGSLAFLPFPSPPPAPTQAQGGGALDVRRPEQRGRGGQRGQGQAGRRGGAGAEAGRGPEAGRSNEAGQGRRGGRGGGGLAAALRGRLTMADISAVHPRELLARHADLAIKELSFTSFAGEPLYTATLAEGVARTFTLAGQAVDGFDRDRISAIVRRALPNPQAVEIRAVDEYDYYYQDRLRRRPLPVILALTHDADGTRHYIDPRTATVVGTYSNRNWARRFFYNGLHSLSFPWLYNHRPLWDIVVITFMIGGTALCVTALVLAWRAVGKKLRQVTRGARARGRESRPPVASATGGTASV